MNNFEKSVRLACIQKEMSLEDLADATGLNRNYIYEIFKTEDEKNTPAKEKIKTVLGIDVVSNNVVNVITNY